MTRTSSRRGQSRPKQERWWQSPLWRGFMLALIPALILALFHDSVSAVSKDIAGRIGLGAGSSKDAAVAVEAHPYISQPPGRYVITGSGWNGDKTVTITY